MTTPHLLDEKRLSIFSTCRMSVVQFVLLLNLKFPNFSAKRQSDLSSFHHHTKCGAEFVFTRVHIHVRRYVFSL